MIQSMTGFASKTIILETEDANKVKVTINIKSLNSRYFDISFKLPYVLNQFETDFIKILKSKLHRGQIYFTIHLSDPNVFKVSIEPAISTISGYLNATKQMKEKFNFKDEISLGEILRLPNVFVLEEKGIDSNNKDLIFNAVNELINELIDERNKEGLALQNDLQDRFDLMKRKIEQIEKLAKTTMEEYKEKVSKKIYELKENFEQTVSENILNSMYLTLDKIDIHEEIVRFKSHLQNIISVMTSTSIEKGKQLDFTLQELAREINTITAKTPNAQIIEQAISIKVEIEKGREQVQNIV